ncbi:MAG: efflux transporter outer membrane subunit [Sulfurimonas sp.]|uniref:efflux transporter outer membrane subunit n=1 Tax=Sulfurimonas sp. TaxID=2022749 RepID=UPI002633AD91|nr:efflux transporter outer membrane subunit [Sulfurimonas sp.]MDD5372205.1 efflux transporter outer membrane subunit [Sulfurimonas sp.]
MRLNNTILLSIVALLGAGCSIEPDFTPPKPNLPIEWKTGEQNSSVEALNKWWEKLGDSTLNALVDKAFEQNREIAVVAAQNESFMAQLGIAESNLLPHFEADASMSRQELLNSTSNRIYGFNLAMSRFEIDFWSKYARAEESAKAALLASEYNAKIVKSSIAANVVSVYNALLTQHRLLENAKKNSLLLEQIASISKAKWEQGVGSFRDVLQAGASADEARGEIPPIEAKISVLENALSLLIGEFPKSFTIPNADISLLEIDIPVGLPSELLRRRPDILSAEASLHSANASIGVAKAAYFPSFSLTAMLGYQSTDFAALLKAPSQIWQVAPSATLPIFDAGQIENKVKYAKAKTKEAQAQYEQTVLKALGEVESALKERRTLVDESKALTNAQKKYIQAELLSRVEYDNGKTGYLPLLIIRQSLVMNEKKIVLNEEAKRENFIVLCKVLGGGWE